MAGWWAVDATCCLRRGRGHTEDAGRPTRPSILHSPRGDDAAQQACTRRAAAGRAVAAREIRGVLSGVRASVKTFFASTGRGSRLRRQTMAAGARAPLHKAGRVWAANHRGASTVRCSQRPTEDHSSPDAALAQVAGNTGAGSNPVSPTLAQRLPDQQHRDQRHRSQKSSVVVTNASRAASHRFHRGVRRSADRQARAEDPLAARCRPRRGAVAHQSLWRYWSEASGAMSDVPR